MTFQKKLFIVQELSIFKDFFFKFLLVLFNWFSLHIFFFFIPFRLLQKHSAVKGMKYFYSYKQQVLSSVFVSSVILDTKYERRNEKLSLFCCYNCLVEEAYRKKEFGMHFLG